MKIKLNHREKVWVAFDCSCDNLLKFMKHNNDVNCWLLPQAFTCFGNLGCPDSAKKITFIKVVHLPLDLAADTKIGIFYRSTLG